MRRLFVFALVCLALSPAAGAARRADLSQEHAQWLDDVRPLISRNERKAFLDLERDHQRTAFIRSFWAARDPTPGTEDNEFRIRYYQRLDVARDRYGEGWQDHRAAVYVLNGDPSDVMATDCGVLTWPMELWTYGYSERLGSSVEILFYQRFAGGPFRMWNPAEGYEVLLPKLHEEDDMPDQEAQFRAWLLQYCGEVWQDVVDFLDSMERIVRDYGILSAEAASPPKNPDPEWLLGFNAFSTDVGEDREPLDAIFRLEFPEPYRQRVVARGLLSVPREAATPVAAGDRESYGFQLTGEVLRGDELFESFRYRFDVPEERLEGDAVPLVFERYLRPGTYTWIVKLEDLGSGRVFRDEREVEVPAVAGMPDAVELPGDVVAAVEETLSAGGGEPASIRFVGRRDRDLTGGLQRFEAETAGDGIEKVAFYLDEKKILTKTRPPYGVELDLGRLPRRHAVRVVALAADGSELATDEVVVNPGRHALAVRWVDPRPGGAAPGPVRARVEVRPGGRARRDRRALRR
ncbi:MAG: GWxTD domain-containing protein [Thermoanaerobaculia bacterium]